jgi:enamine deaminase RidA (YjgF/YER057c/UK114 family)
MAGEVEKILETQGWKLPEVGKPIGSYVNTVRTGSLLFISGKFPKENGKLKYVGKVGREVSEELAQDAARLAVLACLAAAKSAIEDLDRVRRVVRLTGYVASAPGFYDSAKVLDGASDTLTKLFGDRGKHTRLAVGVSELPLNACVELDLILEVE